MKVKLHLSASYIGNLILVALFVTLAVVCLSGCRKTDIDPDHVSAEYVEGSFEFTLVKSDRNNMADIDPGKTIHLKKGKFRIKVN